MLLLHSIIHPRGFYKKTDGSKTKITIELAQESQFLLIPSENDLVRKIEERALFYKNLNIGVQPYIIAVGKNIFDPTTYFVIVDNLTFKFENFVKALDICFKAHTVFNVKFAFESMNVWIFIQKYFYDLNFKSDSFSTDVISLISDLK